MGGILGWRPGGGEHSRGGSPVRHGPDLRVGPLGTPTPRGCHGCGNRSAGRASPGAATSRSSPCRRGPQRCCSRFQRRPHLVPVGRDGAVGVTGARAGLRMESRATSSAPRSASRPPADQERSRAGGRRGHRTGRRRCHRPNEGTGVPTAPSAGATRPSAFVRDADGVVEGSVASIRDVTAEVEAEEHYRLLAETATDLVFLRDTAGTVTWMSPSSRTVLGYEPAGDRRDEHDRLHPPGRSPAGGARCARRSGRARRREVWWRVSAGRMARTASCP